MFLGGCSGLGGVSSAECVLLSASKMRRIQLDAIADEDGNQLGKALQRESGGLFPPSCTGWKKSRSLGNIGNYYGASHGLLLTRTLENHS